MDKELEALALEFGANFRGLSPNSGFYDIQSSEGRTRDLLEALFRNSTFWCDYLIAISGTHRLGPPEMIGVHYHLASIPTGIQVHVFEEKELSSTLQIPEFDSVSNLWKTADWHERETAEMYGIRFVGHPDLRNLLLPANWEGFPMRKNYQQQLEYHGVKVKY
ncbi:MAG TPA: NADH-quinone oxidoreductase subunit C [Catalimonadaceae bacterium]|nr:NADH-quinone oxidoreductase subunit C [Catalimonadaceae bacterium]